MTPDGSCNRVSNLPVVKLVTSYLVKGVPSTNVSGNLVWNNSIKFVERKCYVTEFNLSKHDWGGSRLMLSFGQILNS